MVVVQSNVLQGLYTFLTADSAFNTSIGGDGVTAGRLWWDTTDQDQTYPYVVMTVIGSAQLDCMTAPGYDYLIQFTAYNDPRAGSLTLVTIMDNLRARLNRTTFTVTAHHQMPGEESGVRGPHMELDGQAWRMDADYFIRGFANS